MSEPILDVFQPGLRRGSAPSSYDPSYHFAYVEHPTEGWRVYLRSCMFLHPIGERFYNRRFLVVKRRGASYKAATWEPPKGQMEGKDAKGDQSVIELLLENVRRETEEEAHITEIQHIRHTGYVFQAREKDYPPHTYFQYHIFQGFVTPDQVQQSFDTFEWIKEHPKGFARWRKARREKDAVAWFDPRTTRVNPRWCPDIVAIYLKFVRQPLYMESRRQ